MSAQCSFTFNQHIDSDAEIVLQGNVSDAVNNDLLDPNQGVCGVELHFQHEYVSNLQIELISPSGQKVLLVGFPSSNTNTNGSDWTVTFVPCSQIPIPDPGIPGIWSNTSPWGIGNNYSGSYHPAMGCLEDFNSGPVNGIWKIHILNGSFYEGDFLGFKLIFCDDQGIDCYVCEPLIGELQKDSLNFCENDTDLINYLPAVNFPAGEPDTNLYFLRFMIVSQDIIQYIGESPDFSSLSPGLYQVYSISYLKRFKTELNDLVGKHIDQLRNMILGGLVCAGISNDFINLRIWPIYYLSLGKITLCAGDTFRLAGNYYLSDSLITLKFQNQHGCDSIIAADLHFLKPQVKFELDSIECQDLIANLNVSGIILPDPAGQILQEGWYDAQNNLLSNNGKLNTAVAGRYRYSLQVFYPDRVCSWDTIIEVPSYVIIPDDPLVNSVNACAGLNVLYFVSEDTTHTRTTWIVDGIEVPNNVSDSLWFKWNSSGIHELCVFFSNSCGNSDTLCYQLNIKAAIPEFMDYDSVSCDANIFASTSMASSMINWQAGPGSIIDFSDNMSMQGRIAQSASEAWVYANGEINGCTFYDTLLYKLAPPLELIFPHDTSICLSSILQLHFIGNQDNYSIYYRANGRVDTLISDGSNTALDLTVDNNILLIIDSVITPYSSCKIISPDTINILVSIPPIVEFPDTVVLCNSLNPSGSPVYFPLDFILSGGKTGIWNFSSVTGLEFRNDSIDVSKVLPGEYQVYYQLQPLIPGCGPLDTFLTLKVISCFCPVPGDINLNYNRDYCIGMHQDFDLQSFFSPNTNGQWYALAPGQTVKQPMPGAILVGPLIAGTYIFTFITDTEWQGACPDSIELPLNIFVQPFAGIDQTFAYCQGAQFRLDLDTISGLTSGVSFKPYPPDYKGLSKAYDPANHILQINHLNDGVLNFYVISSGNKACLADTALIQIIIFKNPTGVLTSDIGLDCATGDAELSIAMQDPFNLGIEWFFEQNHLIQYDNQYNISISESGQYTIRVIDTITGCFFLDTSMINPAGKPISNFELKVSKTNCLDSLFALQISNIIGNSSKLYFQLDDEQISLFPQFYQIYAGMHKITIIDGSGCITDTVFTIDESDQLNIWLDRDTSIYEGDSLLMNLYATQDIDRSQIQWFSNSSSIGSQDFPFWISPTETSEYLVLYKDENGCILTASRLVRVIPQDLLYIPNAFSPDGDGVNDFFYIPSNPRISHILKLDIYDRWGNHLFERASFPTGDQALGWDGSFHGKKMNPAVFVYKIKYLLKNGKIKESYGNFTLIK